MTRKRCTQGLSRNHHEVSAAHLPTLPMSLVPLSGALNPMRPRPTRHNAILALVTQAVVSGSSYACLILAGRTLDDWAFSRYALALALLYALHAIPNALFIAPARYFAATLRGETQTRWLANQWSTFLCSHLVLCGLLLLGLWIWGASEWLYLATLMLLLYSGHEFTRAILFIRSSGGLALGLDTTTHALRILACTMLLLAEEESLIAWLGVLSVSLLVWPIWFSTHAMPGYLRHLPGLSASQPHSTRFAQQRASGRYGLPILIESMGSIASTQLLLLACGALLEPADVAALAIATSTLNVLSLAYAGLAQYLLPTARQALQTRGTSAWRHVLLQHSIPCLLAATLLACILANWAEPLITLLFGRAWPTATFAVQVLAIPYCGFALSSLLATAYYSIGKTKIGVTAKLGAGLIAAITLFPMVSAFGFKGALAVYALIPILWTVIYLLAWRNLSDAQSPLDHGHPA